MKQSRNVAHRFKTKSAPCSEKLNAFLIKPGLTGMPAFTTNAKQGWKCKPE